MKKILLILCLLLSLVGCKQQNKVEFTKLAEYVYDLGTFTEIDYEYGNAHISENYDGWGKDQGCSAIATANSEGNVIVGRNLDLSISHKPGYIFKTDVSGLYKTINVAYTCYSGPDYVDTENGNVSEDFIKEIPFLATDAFNEEGFYIEINMRTGEYNEDGSSKFGCSGTNPNANTRLCATVLVRYLADHCKNIEEALALIDTIDVYTINSDALDWNFCFLMADATGDYGILEFVDNKAIWLDKQKCQTNFYLTKEYYDKEIYRAGLGRYDLLMSGIDSVETVEDMKELIDQVKYSYIYSYEISPFDVRSEYVGEEYTSDILCDDNNIDAVTEMLEYYEDLFHSKTREELMDKCAYWESIYTTVTDINNKQISIRFFEDDNRTFVYSFD